MHELKVFSNSCVSKPKSPNIRTQQIELGLQAAIDQELGEWAVKRAGRDFVRVEELTRS
jgi:hypothetical protein